MKIKAILSDAGGILFDFSINVQIEPLRVLLENSGKKLSIDQVCSSYLPYLHKAQTVISEEEAINQFFQDNNCSASFLDYEKIKKPISPEREKSLQWGVTETLEILRDMNVGFYVVTNAKAQGLQFQNDFERMIINQLKERGVYNPEKFNLCDYIKATISSKDLGVRKPEAYFFDAVLSFERSSPLKRDEVVFIAHNSDEIFCAVDLGIPVIAFNYQREKDARGIAARIEEHNKKYVNGISKTPIYPVKRFLEIPQLLTEFM